MTVSADLIVDLPKEVTADLKDLPEGLPTNGPKVLEERAAQLAAEKQLLRAFRRLKRRAKYHFGDFQYLGRMDITLRGRPRITLVTTCADLERGWLARNWRECGGTRIRNYGVLRSLADVLERCGYYDESQFYFSRVFNHRRVRWTPGFFSSIKARFPPDADPRLDESGSASSRKRRLGIYFPRALEFKWLRLCSELLPETG